MPSGNVYSISKIALNARELKVEIPLGGLGFCASTILFVGVNRVSGRDYVIYVFFEALNGE